MLFPYVRLNPSIKPSSPLYKIINPIRPYSLIVADLEYQDWERSQIVVDENSLNMVDVFSVRKSTIGKVVDIKVDPNNLITIRGKENFISGHKASIAYPMRTRFVDSNGADISLTTKIQINKTYLPTDSFELMAKVFYSDISAIKNQGTLTDAVYKTDPEWYRFKNNIIIEGNYSLRLIAINPNTNIDSDLTQFSFEIDFWE